MASSVLHAWALCGDAGVGACGETASAVAAAGGGASPPPQPLSPCDDDRDAPAPAWSLNDEALMWDAELVRARAARSARRRVRYSYTRGQGTARRCETFCAGVLRRETSRARAASDARDAARATQLHSHALDGGAEAWAEALPGGGAEEEADVPGTCLNHLSYLKWPLLNHPPPPSPRPCKPPRSSAPRPRAPLACCQVRARARVHARAARRAVPRSCQLAAPLALRSRSCLVVSTPPPFSV
jgi:hypothetical protein